MKIVKAILALVSSKALTKYLPQVISYILTRVIKYVRNKNPHKLDNIIKEASEVLDALKYSVESAKDGVITEEEVVIAQEKWKKAIEM